MINVNRCMINGCLVCFQPALLYIVPAAIGCLAAHVLWNGEVKQVCYSLKHFRFVFLLIFVCVFLFLTFAVDGVR